MATTMRSVDTRFWVDGWVRKLNALDRYVFLYFLTNTHSSWCGVYELDLEMVAYETGIDEQELINAILPRLAPKIIYVEGWVVIKNFEKYHANHSEKTQKGIENAWKLVPEDIKKKIEGYPMEGVSASASASASALLGDFEKSQQLKENNMGWNIPNDNDSDLPSIGDDGEVEQTDQEKLKKENEKVRALMEWGEKVRGKSFLDKPTQIKHIKLLKGKGISPTKIKDTFVGLVQSDYWKGQSRLPDFKTVVSTLKNERN